VLNVPAQWRIPPSVNERSPFGAGQHGRPLRIVVDDDTAAEGAALDLLRTFERQPGVEIYGTRPDAARRIELAHEHSAHDVIEVRYIRPDGTRIRALGAAASWEKHARQAAGEYGLDLGQTRQGLLLAQAAARHQLDAVISRAAVLEVSSWSSHAIAGHVATPEQACALLGLFLRARNDFTVSIEGNVSTWLEFDRFYRGAAIATLPSYPDWLQVVWSLWRNGRGSEAFGLLRAIDARLGRALIARDYINVRIRHWHPDETWDEVLYFFESFLLSLHGAIDAFARLLHVGLGLPGPPRRAGFQHATWRAALNDAAQSSQLAELTADDASFVAVVESVGVLRNFVHAEMLSEELLRNDDDRPEFVNYGKGLLVLHSTSGDRLTTSIARAGGMARWGIAEGLGGATTVKPTAFLREALEQALAGIEAILATQVLARAAGPLVAPFDPDFWISTRQFTDNLVLLAGLAGAGSQ
jgi:hypothetical protein